MAKKAADEKSPQIYVDETYFRHVDQMERWRQEYEHWQSVEAKIAAVSKFAFDEVDYLSMLERVPFPERPLTDFSYLVDEARIATESKFFMPIAYHLGVMLFLLGILLLVGNVIALWVSGTGVITLLASLYLAIDKRQRTIQKAVDEAQATAQRREEQEKQLIAEQRQKHEEAEANRIKDVERLMAGERASIFVKLDSVLTKIGFPFPLNVDIDVYNNIYRVQVWLPPKTIIPKQTCTLQNSGRPNHSDKETRTINKQYLELCCAIMMQIITVVYAHIPTFDEVYFNGMSKEKVDIECLLAIKTTREAVTTAANAANGIAAIQALQGRFECDTALELLSVEAILPTEWGNVEPQFIRNLRVKLFK